MLDGAEKQLIVELALSAAQRGQKGRIAKFERALPYLVSDIQDRDTLSALLLLGAGKGNEALSLIADRQDANATLVRTMINERLDQLSNPTLHRS